MKSQAIGRPFRYVSKNSVLALYVSVSILLSLPSYGATGLPLLQDQLAPFDSSGLAENAVIITHGWLGDADNNWVTNLAKGICDHPGVSGQSEMVVYKDGLTHYCSAPDWDVWIADWNTKAATGFPFGAKDAFWNAAYVGDVVGAYLRKMGYKHAHFIAHSAGSNLIENAKHQLGSDVSVHMTFLDPYAPPSGDSLMSEYGIGADWVENYVDTRDVTHGLTASDHTKSRLLYGVNFDVTSADPIQRYLDPREYHNWPYELYLNSVSSGAHLYGFPNSKASDGDMNPLSDLPLNSNCMLTYEYGDCAGSTHGIPALIYREPRGEFGDSDFGFVEASRSEEGAASYQNVDGSLGVNMTGALGETTIQLMFDQTLPEGISHLSFDYEFSGDPGSRLTVSYSGEAIRDVSSAVSGGIKKTAAYIWMDEPFGDIAQQFGFALKKPANTEVSVVISNIRFYSYRYSLNPGFLQDTNLNDSSSVFSWVPLMGATHYDIELVDSKGAKHEELAKVEDLSCDKYWTKCSTSWITQVSNGDAKIRIRGHNPSYLGSWSPYFSLKVNLSVPVAVEEDSGEKGGSGVVLWLTWLLPVLVYFLRHRQSHNRDYSNNQ